MSKFDVFKKNIVMIFRYIFRILWRFKYIFFILFGLFVFVKNMGQLISICCNVSHCFFTLHDPLTPKDNISYIRSHDFDTYSGNFKRLKRKTLKDIVSELSETGFLFGEHRPCKENDFYVRFTYYVNSDRKECSLEEARNILEKPETVNVEYYSK